MDSTSFGNAKVLQIPDNVSPSALHDEPSFAVCAGGAASYRVSSSANMLLLLLRGAVQQRDGVMIADGDVLVQLRGGGA